MRKWFSFSLTLCFVAALLYFGIKNSGPGKAFAGDIMGRESFLAMTPYGVAEAHDTDTTLRKAPAIYWGYDTDGAVTISDGTYQNAFNTSCDFRVILTVIENGAITTDLYSAQIATYNTSNSSFTYEVRKSASGTITDVTSTIPVFWVAFGWR